MTRRDAWARVTPYELGIPGREFAARVFAAIEEEVGARGVDPSNPGAFFQLGEVGRALREIQGEERGGEAIERFAAFLFHAWHFHRAGEAVLLLGTEAARELVDRPFGSPPAVPGDVPADGSGVPGEETAPPWSAWDGSLPTEAGYLQLPRHLFWSHPEGEGAAEPLDGFFWTRTSGATLSLLVALGIRSDRPGISVVELPPLPLSEATRWVAGGARAEGPDFATTLPGGELDHLYSIVTLGEVLVLAGRVFGALDLAPERLGPEERPPRPEEVSEERGGTRPSFLPFRRVGTGGGGDPAERSP